jgi:hypothetical protein
MELYLRGLARNETEAGEESPIGIILCAEKNSGQIELLDLGSAGIHAAKYLTVLPLLSSERNCIVQSRLLE